MGNLQLYTSHGQLIPNPLGLNQSYSCQCKSNSGFTRRLTPEKKLFSNIKNKICAVTEEHNTARKKFSLLDICIREFNDYYPNI